MTGPNIKAFVVESYANFATAPFKSVEFLAPDIVAKNEL